MDADLTLEKAITAVRQSEAVKLQQVTLRGQATKSDSTVDAIKRVQQRQKQKGSRSCMNRQTYSRKVEQTTTTARDGPCCLRCGKSPGHSKKDCPAKDAECYKCHKKGHYTVDWEIFVTYKFSLITFNNEN